MSVDALRYQIGFGNDFATEALAGALPVGQSNPQNTPFGLYTEEINGTPFTAPRAQSRRTWTYRMPSLRRAQAVSADRLGAAPQRAFHRGSADAESDALAAVADPESADGFLAGPRHVRRQRRSRTTARRRDAHVRRQRVDDGSILLRRGRRAADRPAARRGCSCARSSASCHIAPGEICVVPRGVKFRVELLEGSEARGYVCELRPRLSPARARPDRGRTVSRTRATSCRRSRLTRSATATR